MYHRILVPLDGSGFAEAALPHAHALAVNAGAELALLRVVLPPRAEYQTPEPLRLQAVYLDTEADALAYLDSVAADLRAAGLRVTVEVCTGPVVETILDYAESIHADLIVMSTHGRSGMARWFIGSVADKVVRAARLPVLLARPEPDAS